MTLMTIKSHPAILLAMMILVPMGLNAQWDDPLVYYQFNENTGVQVADSSRHGFHGTADCSDCWEAEGKFKGALEFRGNHRVDLPATEIGLTNEKGTVAFWMLLPESSVSTINCIWWAGEYGGDMFGPQNEMHINSEFVEANIWSGGEVAFVVNDSVAGESYFIYSDPWKGPNPATQPSGNEITLADGTWHHVACTWAAGGTVALYIDGETIWDSASYNPNLWDCNLMTLGVANERPNRRLIGYLDEFRIYDEALDSAGIGEIYNYIPAGIPDAVRSNKKDRDKALNCFPNPADRTILIRHPGDIELVEVYSLTGRRIIRQQVTGNNQIVEIDVEPLTSGCYFIEASGRDGFVATGKFFRE